MKLGNTDISKIYHGSNELLKVYKGGDEIWTPGGADPIQVLVDAYKVAVEAISGGAVEDETAVYNAIDADVTAGLVANDGTNTKSVIRVGYKFGLVTVGGKIDELVSLYKIGGVYPTFKSFNSDTRGQLEADHIDMIWNAPTIGRFETNLDLDYGKNSFFVEFKGHAYYVSGTSYFLTEEPANSMIKFGTGTTQRTLVVSYSPSTVTVFSNNNFWLDEFATYRFELIRSGDTCTPKLYRNGALFQTMADRTWDKNLVYSASLAIKLTGSSTSTIKLQEYKIGLI